MLEKDDIAALGHNSPAYVHLVTEAVKLACADREAYFGDPRFIDVPLAELLSPLFQSRRRKLIDPPRAFPALRSPATIDGHPRPRVAPVPHQREPALSPDTSYCAAIDRAGNVFSATPSDPSYDAELVPGTGLVPAGRGSQSWTVEGHPSEIMPFKRPRLTPNPAIAILENGRAVMPFGTPGGDVQTQAMLQVLLNLTAFGMDLRTAIEAPRFASYAFPSSFEPHEAYQNRLAIEGRMEPATRDGLLALGHEVLDWPDWTRLAGTVCAVIMDRKAGVLTAAADPRRAAYAVGWGTSDRGISPAMSSVQPRDTWQFDAAGWGRLTSARHHLRHRCWSISARVGIGDGAPASDPGSGNVPVGPGLIVAQSSNASYSRHDNSAPARCDSLRT